MIEQKKKEKKRNSFKHIQGIAMVKQIKRDTLALAKEGNSHGLANKRIDLLRSEDR